MIRWSYLPLIFGDGVATAAEAAVALFERDAMSTNVYIDGLNLFHGSLKGSEHKWLDIRRLAEELLPRESINDVFYFTARMMAKDGDGSKRQRQDLYLRALTSLPRIEAVYGTHRRRGDSWEEKKTDVNIATQMIFDAFLGNFTSALLVSNDSDLFAPVKRIRDDLKLPVIVANPVSRQRVHQELRQAATRVIEIEPKHLQASQLPPRIQDASGRVLTKPVDW